MAALGKASPTSIFRWNLGDALCFVSGLKFRIPGQDGCEHIFDC